RTGGGGTDGVRGCATADGEAAAIGRRHRLPGVPRGLELLLEEPSLRAEALAARESTDERLVDAALDGQTLERRRRGIGCDRAGIGRRRLVARRWWRVGSARDDHQPRDPPHDQPPRAKRSYAAPSASSMQRAG